MSSKNKVGHILGAAAALILALGLAVYFLLHSPSFHQFVLQKIEHAASDSIGGPVEIQNFSVKFSSLTANAYGITVHGTESQTAPPLLQADQLTIRFKIVSLLERKVDLNEIVIRHPVAKIMVAASGSTNLPHTPKSGNSSGTIFDLGVKHALVSDGEIYYNDKKALLNADLHDLRLEVTSHNLSNSYDGSISYKNGEVQYGNSATLPHNLDARFTASPSELKLNPLRFTVASSTLQLEGRVINYNAPSGEGTYNVALHPEDFRSMLKNPNVPAGEIVLTGSLHYQNSEHRPLLQSIALAGRVQSHVLRVDSPDVRATIQNLQGEFNLNKGNFEARGVLADILNGQVTATAKIENLQGTPSGHFTASAKSLSIEAAKSALKGANLAQAPVDGSMDLSLVGAWTKGLDTLKAHSDLAVKGSLASTAAAKRSRVPLSASAHVDYDGGRALATLRNTLVRTPSSTVAIAGTAGQNLDLRATAHLTDLRELDALAAALKPAHQGQPASETLNLAGTADTEILVRGTKASPLVTGQVHGRNLRFQNSQWKSLQASFNADKSGIFIRNGSLVNAGQGYLTFDVSAALRNWAYSPSNTITADINARSVAVNQLLQIVNANYPVTGNVSADISFRGSQQNPVGNGRLELSQAVIYGEPLQRLQLSFSGDGNALTSDMTAALAAGNTTMHLVLYPKNKGYAVRLDAPSIDLARLKTVEKRNLQLSGLLSVNASGRGTMDNPQLNCTIAVPKLQMRQASVSGIKAQLGVANHEAQLAVDSEVAQSFVQARGTVELEGDYPAKVSLDTKAVPVEGLLALYMPVKTNGPHGQFEVHASASGPLKKPERMQAQLVIPTLNAAYQQMQIANKGPIRARYENSVLNLEPSEIAGTDTNLRMQGQLPLKGNAPMTLSAVGDVNMQLLRMVSPDLQSSGNLRLNVRASGTVGHPSLVGEIQVQNVAFLPVDAPLGVQNVNGVLNVHNDQVTITKLTGKAGGGDVSITGLIDYRPQLQVNVAVNAKDVRVRYQDTIRIILDTDLNLVGTTEAANLTGRVLIDSLGFTQNFDLAQLATQFQSGSESPPATGFANNVKVNVAVQSSRNLNVASTALSLQGQADLRVIGTAADPVIVGRTQFDAGEIFLMNNRYQIERGIIEFLNPSRTQPVVNLLLTTTINQYRLSLNFVGPIDKMRTNYISDPPLPTADIINLIARGQTSEQAANGSPANFGASSLLAKGVSSGVSSGLQRLAGLSSLSIDPTLGGNDPNPGARIAFQKRVTSNFFFTFATDVTSAQREIIQGEYRLNRRWSVSATRDENGGVAVDGKFHTRF